MGEEYIPQWWGPRRITTEVVEADVRPGGAWRFLSRDADGKEHPFRGVYREIVPPKKMVWTFVYDVPPINQFESVETMTLEERDGRTYMTAISAHGSKEARDGMVQSGMEEGAAETYDRLEDLLATLATRG
ncbi:MAG: SRPBCC domain-containing protein [Armatimonadota bacterium]